MIRRILCALLLAAVGLLPASGTAVAHPLGNFTVNRLAQVDVAGDTLAIHYVLDQAEVPTMVDADAARSDPDGFAARRAARIADSLSLRIDGMPVALVVDDHRLSLPDGEAGLDTLRLVVRFVADVPASSPGTWHRAELEDANDPDRLGWREIVVAAHGTAEVSGSDVPADDLADGLRDYPERLLERPLDVRTASFSFQLGTETVPSRPLARDDDAGALGDQRGLAGWMTDQVTGSSWLVAAVGVAFVVGMFHALGPGHGKTMMAAYLLSTRGRARDAVAIAVAVALMHSLSVLVLGAMMLQVGILTRPEVVFPWLSLASGVAVVAVGAHLCRQRFGERVLAGHAHGHAQAQGHGHDHSHAHSHAQSHGHGHGHSHGHGHDHSLPPGVSPLSWRGLLGLATAGGLLPSPSALVVLVGAVALGQVGFGFLMIGFFSIGLAVTLAAVGLLLVWARDAAERRMLRGRWILELAPRISAAALVVLGVAVVVDATMRLT